jgi:hypothetical protein
MVLAIGKDESSRVLSGWFVSERLEDDDEDVVEMEAAAGYRCLCVPSIPEYTTGAEEILCCSCRKCGPCDCLAGTPTLAKAGVLVKA